MRLGTCNIYILCVFNIIIVYRSVRNMIRVWKPSFYHTATALLEHPF